VWEKDKLMHELLKYLQRQNVQKGCIRCAYEVPGKISLCNLKGTMQHDCSKDMAVHVSSCSSYDFNALKPVVWKMW
jgi:hypothetical protein